MEVKADAEPEMFDCHSSSSASSWILTEGQRRQMLPSGDNKTNNASGCQNGSTWNVTGFGGELETYDDSETDDSDSADDSEVETWTLYYPATEDRGSRNGNECDVWVSKAGVSKAGVSKAGPVIEQCDGENPQRTRQNIKRKKETSNDAAKTSQAVSKKRPTNKAQLSAVQRSRKGGRISRCPADDASDGSMSSIELDISDFYRYGASYRKARDVDLEIECVFGDESHDDTETKKKSNGESVKDAGGRKSVGASSTDGETDVSGRTVDSGISKDSNRSRSRKKRTPSSYCTDCGTSKSHCCCRPCKTKPRTRIHRRLKSPSRLRQRSRPAVGSSTCCGSWSTDDDGARGPHRLSDLSDMSGDDEARGDSMASCYSTDTDDPAECELTTGHITTSGLLDGNVKMSVRRPAAEIDPCDPCATCYYDVRLVSRYKRTPVEPPPPPLIPHPPPVAPPPPKPVIITPIAPVKEPIKAALEVPSKPEVSHETKPGISVTQVVSLVRKHFGRCAPKCCCRRRCCCPLPTPCCPSPPPCSCTCDPPSPDCRCCCCPSLCEDPCRDCKTNTDFSDCWECTQPPCANDCCSSSTCCCCKIIIRDTWVRTIMVREIQFVVAGDNAWKMLEKVKEQSHCTNVDQFSWPISGSGEGPRLPVHGGEKNVSTNNNIM